MSDIDIVQKALKENLKNTIGQDLDSLEDNIISSVSRTLNTFIDSEVLSNAVLTSCDTRHNAKNIFGKITDWIKWKSPLHRFFYKPKYVQIEIVDIFHRLWDNGRLDISEEEFDAMCKEFSGVKTWEEKYPEDPYTNVDVSINIYPTKPVEFIKVDFVVGGEK